MQKLKKLPWKIIAVKFSDTTRKRKQYDNDEESTSSGEEKEEEEEEEEYEVEDDSTDRGVIKKEDCSNEASSKTKNVQKASTPPSKRQLTVMETLQINKMKRDKEAGDEKIRKHGKNTAEVTAEKSHFLQQVDEYVSKKHGKGQLIVNF